MSFVMADFYKRFVDEELDSEGRLKSFKLDLPENFNFSYDVIDELAKNVPDKVAMQWVNEEGEEHIFTYKDLSEKSSQVANMMLAHGVKKGDFVMAVLKRHYEFWFLAYGLMKIGAILVPATCQLKKKTMFTALTLLLSLISWQLRRTMFLIRWIPLLNSTAA